MAAVDATTWNNYQGGIIQYHCEHFPNHAVQIVGYDLTGNLIKHFLVTHPYILKHLFPVLCLEVIVTASFCTYAS